MSLDVYHELWFVYTGVMRSEEERQHKRQTVATVTVTPYSNSVAMDILIHSISVAHPKVVLRNKIWLWNGNSSTFGS